MLRPILKAVRQIPAYQRRCKLEADELVIQGKHYTIDKLNKLPSDLNVFSLTSKSNEDTIGYLGELNPLSNFHLAPFTLNGVHYICSEQFIQHTNKQLLQTAMESMTSAVTRLIESNEAMIKHKEVMDDLTQENRTLATRINRLESEHYKLKDKFDKIENKELEHSIILQGIEEQEDADETGLTEYVYYELSYTIDSQSEHERWRQIKQMEITRCKRIGAFSHDRPRAMRVEFQHRLDVEYILSNKKHLR